MVGSLYQVGLYRATAWSAAGEVELQVRQADYPDQTVDYPVWQKTELVVSTLRSSLASRQWLRLSYWAP